MSDTESMRPDQPQRPTAEAALSADRAARTRAAMELMRTRAREAAEQARIRARSEITRRRAEAAERLESLAGALRPQDRAAKAARARRKTAMIAGGSTFALTAMLGVGVMLGWLLSRQMTKRAALSAQGARPALPPAGVDSPEALVNVGGLTH
jgi:hypothetical protein